MKSLTVVLPCYNTRECISQLYLLLKDTLDKLVLDESLGEYSLLFVDDCSPQKDFLVIEELLKNDPRIKLVKLTRNFGQQAAISCGLALSKDDWVVVMDADLQDRPQEIPRLVQTAMKGYDIVFTRVKERKDSNLKKLFAMGFYSVFSMFTDVESLNGYRNFGIYHRKVVDAFLSLDEQFRGFALLVRWLGFKSTVIEVQHDRREIGRSSYDFVKGLNLAIDSILTFSDKPLRITTISGFVVSFLSIMAGLVFLLRGLMGYRVVLGWTSLILSIWFLSGFTVFCVGLIGLYVGKVFNETKKRPHYIVDYTVNIDEEV